MYKLGGNIFLKKTSFQVKMDLQNVHKQGRVEKFKKTTQLWSNGGKRTTQLP